MHRPRSTASDRSSRFRRWPVLLSAGVAIFFLVAISTVRETYREWKIDQEIQGLEDNIERLEGKRTVLLDTIQRLQSTEALDREARTRLSMRKSGERVIMVRGLPDSTTYSWQEPWPEAATSTALAAETTDPGTNPRRWFRYFFHFTLPAS